MPSIDVLGSPMYYRQSGAGTPVVFLHGNPTSSHLWRDVLPRMGPGLRSVAPDLIGMGRSGKPDIGYTFDDHARHLDAFLDALDLPQLVLVGQDWGGALAFDWASRHPGRTLGVAFLETIMRPMAWEDFPAPARDRFASFRTPGLGEQLVLEQNVFLESFNQSVLSGLADEDLKAYQEPYPTPESRLPVLQWSRSMPLGGEPADVIARITAYDAWLAASADVPKLLLTFDSSPTLMIDERMAAWCRENVAALAVRHCGPAGHLAPEDQPEAIAAAVAAWVRDAVTVPATLSPQIVGQAENAHNAVLARALKGTGLTREHWIALSVAAAKQGAGAGGVPVDGLTDSAATALKIDREQVPPLLAALVDAGLLAAEPDLLTVTDAAKSLITQVRGAVSPIVARAYRDVPAADLQIAARVLAAVTAGLDRELHESHDLHELHELTAEAAA